MQPSAGNLNSIKKSLELNLKIQALLEEEIAKTGKLIALNKEKQATLAAVEMEEKRLRKMSKRSRYSRSARLFAAPYFRDAKDMAPPPNEDTVIKRKNHEMNAALLFPPRPWTPEEHEQLLRGVGLCVKLSAVKPLERRRDHIKKKIGDETNSDDAMRELKDDLYIVEQKMRLVNRKSLPDLLEQLKGNIDWMTVSATHMNGTRTPEECEIMWKNYLSFDVNKDPFSEKEDSKLADLAQNSNERNWDAIASSLKAFEKCPLMPNSLLTLAFLIVYDDRC